MDFGDFLGNFCLDFWVNLGEILAGFWLDFWVEIW